VNKYTVQYSLFTWAGLHTSY